MLTEPRRFLSAQSIPASEFLREKCPVTSNITIKYFARWYCKSRSGRLAPEPNLVSTTNTLKKFSSTLRGILNRDSPSSYRSELESAVARKEHCKYRCMEYATASYYGPRGQQVM